MSLPRRMPEGPSITPWKENVVPFSTTSNPMADRVPANTPRSDGKLEGIVQSFVPSKGYGFVQSADGKSYWFRLRDFSPVPETPDALDGALVIFDPMPGPRGLVAKDLSLAREQALEWHFSEKLIPTENSAPSRGEVIECLPTFSCESDENVNDARNNLHNLAQSLGANALLSVRYSKSTGSRGNYRYTIHIYEGIPALVAQRRMCADLERVARSEKLCEEKRQWMRDRYTEYLRRQRRLVLAAWCILGVLAVGFYTSIHVWG